MDHSSRGRQELLARIMVHVSELEDEALVDIASAVGGVVINLICEVATNRDDAMEGLYAWMLDMECAIDERFLGTSSSANH